MVRHSNTKRMSRELTPQETAERSLIKTYRKSIWNPFIAAVKRYELIEPGDRIAVCISGGKDSVILAKLMQELQRHTSQPFELVFMVMDPGYKPENRKLIEDNAALLGIPITIFDSDIFDVTVSVEKNPCYLCARMRRGHLYSKAKELGIRPVAELLSFAVAGCEPDYMGLGPIYAAPKALADHSDYASHADLMWAGMLAHNNSCGIGRDQDWASHQIEHELSAFYDCAHGAGLAVILPAWMEYVLPHDPVRLAQFAVRVFGCEMNFADPEATARQGIEKLCLFFHSLGMPITFDELGAKAKDIPDMVAHRAEKPGGFPFGGFVKIQPADMEAILRLAAGEAQ
mgnify:CR=1 FL=1